MRFYFTIYGWNLNVQNNFVNVSTFIEVATTYGNSDCKFLTHEGIGNIALVENNIFSGQNDLIGYYFLYFTYVHQSITVRNNNFTNVAWNPYYPIIFIEFYQSDC